MKDLTYFSSGRTRIVYLLPGDKYVLKAPANEKGIHDNFYEAELYHQYRLKGDIIPKARCRIVPGTFFLVMEKVIFPKDYSNLPDWTNWVDSIQVGYNSKGMLVAYDYGWY